MFYTAYDCGHDNVQEEHAMKMKTERKFHCLLALAAGI